jgi:predicted unusual protein kinase regulating ubiquinone biosynthesis (AarF/ABC1/UbiB family)
MDWVEGIRPAEAVATLSEEQKRKLVDGLVGILLKMLVSDSLFHAD